MFETLETRQFLSATPAADTLTTDTSSDAAVEATTTTDIRNAGDNRQGYLTYKMKNCFVTSYSTSGA